jgi:hypothetical protein
MILWLRRRRPQGITSDRCLLMAKTRKQLHRLVMSLERTLVHHRLDHEPQPEQAGQTDRQDLLDLDASDVAEAQLTRQVPSAGDRRIRLVRCRRMYGLCSLRR